MLRLPAPAKINWDLYIPGKRDDGYHELDSVFVTISLADYLTFTPAPQASQVTLTCSDPRLGVGPDNLVLKAAELLRQRYAPGAGAGIHLEKKIPWGGGLGGGSSDAATTLMGLNQLWNLELDRHVLAGLAREIGSDVAFFLYGGWRRCRGRGEVVEALPDSETWPGIELYLILPDLAVPTPEVYRNLGAPRISSSFTHRPLTKIALEVNDTIRKVASDLHPELQWPANDLLKAVGKVEPKLERLWGLLTELFPQTWQLSGSGAAHVAVPGIGMDDSDVQSRLSSLEEYSVRVQRVRAPFA